MTFPDFEEFFACLNAHRVKYLIVGGYAVGFHARPRATKDIDVLVERTAANTRRVRAAITEFFGSSPVELNDAKLLDPRTLIVLGHPPVRVDVLTAIDGVAFRPAWGRSAEGTYGAVPVRYLSLEDLISSKRAAGRPQDLADLDVLERTLRRRTKKR